MPGRSFLCPPSRCRRFEVPTALAAISHRNFKSKGGTATHKLASALSLPKFVSDVLQCMTNFGSGALARLTRPRPAPQWCAPSQAIIVYCDVSPLCADTLDLPRRGGDGSPGKPARACAKHGGHGQGHDSGAAPDEARRHEDR